MSNQHIKPNKCAVCEKGASYYHYNVPSCNGCKHFFRRSIIENRIYFCLENSNCYVENGIKCRACRLNKCLNVGMDKLIVQKLASTRKLKLNQNCLFSQENKQKNDENNNKKLFLSIIPTINKNSEISKILSELINIENKKFYIRNSLYGISNELMFVKTLDDFLKESNTNLLNLYEKFESGPPLSVDSTEITELMEGKNLNKHVPSYFFMDLYLSIELLRSMPFYEELNISDKRYLLSNVSMMIRTFDSNYYSSLQNTQTLILPNKSTPILMLNNKMLKIKEIGENNLSFIFVKTFERLKRIAFCSLMQTIKNLNINQNEFVLLRSILICNWDIPKISLQGKIKMQNSAELYSKILLKYLQLNKGDLEGVKRYSDLIFLINAIMVTTKAERDMNLFKELIEEQFKDEETIKEFEKEQKLAPFVYSCL